MVGWTRLLILLLIVNPALAGTIDTPDCRRDLAAAGRLVNAIAGRENSVKPQDIAGLCRLLRRNLPDMMKARDAMDRCLTGHEHGENVGRMDVSIQDIRYVLAAKCGG